MTYCVAIGNPWFLPLWQGHTCKWQSMVGAEFLKWWHIDCHQSEKGLCDLPRGAILIEDVLMLLENINQ
jgi:hypothetical protein